jgi:2-polyprenyl-3-methyl-5-hydroxy-6-metoxy-1,4-benzoquinol methylase
VPPWPGGRLYQCRRCHLGFRDPVHDDEQYTALYAQADGDVWQADRLRRDQDLVRRALLAEPKPQRVLDVGCYDGLLLASLGAQVQRFGVEASLKAAELARTRDVQIVAQRAAELAQHTGRYDAVVAVDVIEHLVRPDAFLALLAGCLAPGGRLVISTGALDTPQWQATGGAYWYCQFPEHIAFFSPAWGEALAPQLGLQLSRVERFSYLQGSPWWRFKRRLRYQRKRLGQPRNAASAPQVLGEPGLFADHVLMVFEHAAPARAQPAA